MAVTCGVCFEILPTSAELLLMGCGHRSCRQCLARHVATKLAQGEHRIVCFESGYWGPCTRELSLLDVQRLVDDTTFRKYQRLKFLQENPVYGRHCPWCDVAQICPNSASQPVCVCRFCRKIFCFTHGNAHAHRPLSCAETERENQQSLAIIKLISKPCPKCHVPIQKNGGCDHMYCTRCSTAFNWSAVAFNA